MRCKNCNYPLWNIVARRCPECGVAFVPSDFTFVLNSVRFCCPHCTQDYYGTSPTGHLVPDEFDCVRCHAHIHADECVLQPTAGVSEQQTLPGINPWCDRRTMSWVNALWTTLWSGNGNAVNLLKVTPPASSLPRALGFYTILYTTFIAVGTAPIVLLRTFGGGVPFAGVNAIAVTHTLGWLLAPLILLFVWAGTAHLILTLTGAVAHPFRRTVHAFAYTFGVNFPTMIPCVGILAAPVTMLVWAGLSSAALAEAQSVSPDRAGIAVFALPLLALLTILVLGVSTQF